MRGITLFAFLTVMVSAALAAPKVAVAPELDVDALVKALTTASETIEVALNTGAARLEEILSGTPELEEMKSLLESTTTVAQALIVVLLGEIPSLDQQGVIDSSITTVVELNHFLVISLSQLLETSSSLSDELFYESYFVLMNMYFEVDEAIFPVLWILEPYFPDVVFQRLSSKIKNYRMPLLKRQRN